MKSKERWGGALPTALSAKKRIQMGETEVAAFPAPLGF